MIKTMSISNNIFKFTGNDVVNCYLLKKEKILIDTGNPLDREELKSELSKVIELEKIQTVLLTHLHFDHSGNVCLFTNAKFYTSQDEITALEEHGSMLTFDMFGYGVNKDLGEIELLPIEEFSHPNIKVFHTPGHSPGEISFLYEEDGKKYLFSGDVIFENGSGRIDLPTSRPDQMRSSIDLLNNLDYDVLCPGHDY